MSSYLELSSAEFKWSTLYGLQTGTLNNPNLTERVLSEDFIYVTSDESNNSLIFGRTNYIYEELFCYNTVVIFETLSFPIIRLRVVDK